MTTLFYRFKDVPEDRPGGPWWHREFTLPYDVDRWLNDLKPFLEEHVIEDDHDCCDTLDCQRRYPATRTPPGGGQYIERIWMQDCNYQAHGYCNKCGRKHDQNYEEAHGLKDLQKRIGDQV